MTRLLHLDASPRPGRAGSHDHGSHTRRLTHHFVSRWRTLEPDAEVVYRDIGANPPPLTSVEWIEAEFTPTESGSYYNEVFVDVSCSAPSSLISEGVTTQDEYCAAYSWPTSGVLVPSYDVRSISGGLTGQGNAVFQTEDGAQLTSWHIY